MPADLLLPQTSLQWIAVVASYLLGAVPFGLVFARVLKGIDLRTVGSGNIGTTNTVRALGKGWGLVVFALDFLKGWVPTAIFATQSVWSRGDDPSPISSMMLWCGAAAVLGHCFPVYLGFKGGKGVATGCGSMVAFDPLVFVYGGVVWLVTLVTTRFVGLASVLMGISFPIIAYVRHPEELPFLIGAVLLTLLILIRHRSNIARMLAGTEPRAGSKRSTPTTHV